MFAFIGNILLCYIVFLLRILTSLMANYCIVPIVDYILIILSRILVQIVFKALGNLVVPIKHFIVVKLTTKQ